MATVNGQDPTYELRHSAAHVMAQAVKEMFPEAKLGWGPPHDRFEGGFYYDLDLPRPLTPEDFPEIQERMRRIVMEDHPFRYRVVGAGEARQLFAGQPYKLETIAELEEGKDDYREARSGAAVISTYTQDAFEDLCLGPHLERTGQIPVDGFRLLDVSGAYWLGSEKNSMLQRVHGTVWPSKEELASRGLRGVPDSAVPASVRAVRGGARSSPGSRGRGVPRNLRSARHKARRRGRPRREPGAAARQRHLVARLKRLFRIIGGGSPPLRVATFDGGLFDSARHPFVEQCTVEFVDLPLVNRIRSRVEEWREADYPGVTGTTRRLLGHRRDPEQREGRRFFCQLEAVETLVLGWIPFVRSRVAHVCLRSWKRMFGSPALISRGLK